MQKCIEVEGNRRLVFVSMDVNKYLYAHQNTLYIIDINLELNTTECAVQRTEREKLNILAKLRCVLIINNTFIF